jgi:hypothetical protein
VVKYNVRVTMGVLIVDFNVNSKLQRTLYKKESVLIMIKPVWHNANWFFIEN